MTVTLLRRFRGRPPTTYGARERDYPVFRTAGRITEESRRCAVRSALYYRTQRPAAHRQRLVTEIVDSRPRCMRVFESSASKTAFCLYRFCIRSRCQSLPAASRRGENAAPGASCVRPLGRLQKRHRHRSGYLGEWRPQVTALQRRSDACPRKYTATASYLIAVVLLQKLLAGIRYCVRPTPALTRMLTHLNLFV